MSEQQPLNNLEIVEPYFGIKIAGNPGFQANTQSALDLLHVSASFCGISQFLRKIEQAERSGMIVFPPEPTFEVGELTANSDPVWYASCIAHEAKHALLYHLQTNGEARSSINHFGTEAERVCMQFQVEVLNEMEKSIGFFRRYKVKQFVQALQKNIINPTHHLTENIYW